MVHFCFLISIKIQDEVSSEIIALIAYVTFFVLAIVVVFIIFYTTFQRRKNQLLLDKINQQKAFDEELIRTQQEIQEETLKHVGRELHDNIGQLLAFATMQLNAVEKASEETILPKVTNAQEALASSLTEVRALSKSLNNDVVFSSGFDEAVRHEVDRLNNSGLIEATVEIKGDKVNFENGKDEVMLFRILQEFFSNTLKYANAEKLEVIINYQKNSLKINVSDDGDGFDINSAKNGSGLINMKKRADLINAAFELSSKPENFTRLKLKYPYRVIN